MIKGASQSIHKIDKKCAPNYYYLYLVFSVPQQQQQKICTTFRVPPTVWPHHQHTHKISVCMDLFWDHFNFSLQAEHNFDLKKNNLAMLAFKEIFPLNPVSEAQLLPSWTPGVLFLLISRPGSFVHKPTVPRLELSYLPTSTTTGRAYKNSHHSIMSIRLPENCVMTPIILGGSQPFQYAHRLSNLI